MLAGFSGEAHRGDSNAAVCASGSASTAALNNGKQHVVLRHISYVYTLRLHAHSHPPTHAHTHIWQPGFAGGSAITCTGVRRRPRDTTAP